MIYLTCLILIGYGMIIDFSRSIVYPIDTKYTIWSSKQSKQLIDINSNFSSIILKKYEQLFPSLLSKYKKQLLSLDSLSLFKITSALDIYQHTTYIIAFAARQKIKMNDDTLAICTEVNDAAKYYLTDYIKDNSEMKDVQYANQYILKTVFKKYITKMTDDYSKYRIIDIQSLTNTISGKLSSTFEELPNLFVQSGYKNAKDQFIKQIEPQILYEKIKTFYTNRYTLG